MKLPDFFGLDIGNHTIKIAEVEYKRKTPHVERIGMSSTPTGVIGSTDDNKLSELAHAIENAKKEAGTKADKCVAALPESVIFSRVIEVPFSKDEGKMEETVYWEARQHIPTDIDEVQIDWIPLQRLDSGNGDMSQIFLVAAPKGIVQQYQNACKRAGVELIALETESVATSRVLSFDKNIERPVLVLDFGAEGTDMSVIKKDKLIFAQSLGTGSDGLTKAIANDYGISTEQAEQYKRAYGLDPNKGEGKIAKSLTPVMEIVINEINKTINYFKAHMKEGSPQEILVVGDGAKLIGLSDYISNRLNIRTVVADPIEKLKINNSAKSNLETLSSVGFTVALGLAMKTE